MPLPRLLPACIAALVLLAATAAVARPKVGLVLGGGGARGAAHIGVLEVLERLRVPVDCVAGTSMGALVAGAWAAGLSPQEMRQALDKADWADMFQDNADYADLSIRNKRLSQRFLPGSETGLKDGSAITPPGVVLGQKIKLFFNQLVHADRGEPQIDELPLQLSIIATDIASGERVVFRDGSLTQAMRASMSVPGLMAPLEYRGRKLVDGGLVDNLPVREVRERCGAEVVIAVNVGSPPLPAEEITGLLSITAQMMVLLTEQNVALALSSLKETDVLIRPDLAGVSSGDFALHNQAADQGRAAAELAHARLAAWAVDEPAWAAWRERVAVHERAIPKIDEVVVAGLLRVDETLVRRQIEQQAGQPLDAARLVRDLGRAFGDGHYEWLDYSVLRIGGRHVLARAAGGKELGPRLPAPGRAAGKQPQPGLELPAARRLPPHLAQPAGRRGAGHRRTGQRLGPVAGPVPAAERHAGLVRGTAGRVPPGPHRLLAPGNNASPSTAPIGAAWT